MNKKLYIEDELVAGRRIPDEHRALYTEIDILYHRLDENRRMDVLKQTFGGNVKMVDVVLSYNAGNGEQEKFLRAFLSNPAAKQYGDTFLGIMRNRIRATEDAVYSQLCQVLGSDPTVGMCFELDGRYIALSESQHSFTNNAALRYVFIDGRRAYRNSPTAMTYKVMLEKIEAGRLRLLSKREVTKLRQEGEIEKAVAVLKEKTRRRRRILFGKD